MLQDVSLFSTYMENLGTTFTNLTTTTNFLVFSISNLMSTEITEFIEVMQLWPTPKQAELGRSEAVLSTLYGKTYFKKLGWLYHLSPYLHSLDYLHLFLLKQYMWNCSVITALSNEIILNKPVILSVNFGIIGHYLFSKWGYAVFVFGLTYFFTHLMKFRYQYGFNFFFNYFKILSDLGEQEYGSYDDFKFFLFFLVQMFMWYCWVLFIGFTFSVQSESRLMLLTLTIMLTILTIPTRLLWDFGLAFGMYVRGAASSSNLIVEAFFDIIGVIIIFTRFIVQNIRFLLVFVAFFELFEWAATNIDPNVIIEAFTDLKNVLPLTLTGDTDNAFKIIIIFLKSTLIYLYHLLHLIIVSFMQIGVYLMVSFWLFFFLYTSFFKVTTENYFSVKRNN